MERALVGIIMGSVSDKGTMERAEEVLGELESPTRVGSSRPTARRIGCLSTRRRPSHAGGSDHRRRRRSRSPSRHGRGPRRRCRSSEYRSVRPPSRASTPCSRSFRCLRAYPSRPWRSARRAPPTPHCSRPGSSASNTRTCVSACTDGPRPSHSKSWSKADGKRRPRLSNVAASAR